MCFPYGCKVVIPCNDAFTGMVICNEILRDTFVRVRFRIEPLLMMEMNYCVYGVQESSCILHQEIPFCMGKDGVRSFIVKMEQVNVHIVFYCTEFQTNNDV